jgi:G3E family GTPase
MEDLKQVYLIYGFLESGKSSFINFTLSQDYFKMEEKTLLVVCEEGEIEYSEEKLKENNTVIEYIDEFDDFTVEKLLELDAKHEPERIVIEYNGMWDAKDIKLPLNWEIRQQITIADYNKFDIYFANMKSLYADMIRNSELIIMNRCADLKNLNNYKLSIKAINNQIETVFEDADGEIDLPFNEEDLPFDLKADIVDINEENYGVWYLDLWENTQRYQGKKFKVKAIVMKSPSLPKNYFVAGRPAMTCCEDDIVFMGLIAKSRAAKDLVDKDWIDIICTVVDEYRSDYGGNGPVLYVEKLEKTDALKNPLVMMG